MEEAKRGEGARRGRRPSTPGTLLANTAGALDKGFKKGVNIGTNVAARGANAAQKGANYATKQAYKAADQAKQLAGMESGGESGEPKWTAMLSDDARSRLDRYDVLSDRKMFTYDRRVVSPLKNMIMYLTLCVCFTFAVFARQDQHLFYEFQLSVRNQLEGGSIYATNDMTFADIRNADDAFAYVKNVMLPVLYQKGLDYNGREFPAHPVTAYSPYLHSYVNLVLGTVRIRQVQASGDTCPIKDDADSLEYLPECVGKYEIINEETSDLEFDNGTTVFRYRAESQMDDGGNFLSPVTGIRYGAGGYHEDLPLDVAEATAKVEELQTNFATLATRAIFVDFSLYNPNADLFLRGRHIFERLPSGSWYCNLFIHSAPLLQDIRALSGDGVPRINTATVIIELMVYIIVIYYMFTLVDEIVEAYDTFTEFVKSPWNCIDVAIAASFTVTIVLRVFWLLAALTITYNNGGADWADVEIEDRQDSEFFKLRQAVAFYIYSRNVFGGGILLCFFKSFRFMAINPRFSLFTRTISKSINEMVTLTLVLAVIIFGFAVAFRLTVGHALPEYRTFTEATISLLLMLLGSFNLQSIRDTAPFFGTLLFVTYCLITVFVLLSMLLKIVDSAFETSRAEGKENASSLAQLGNDFRRAVHLIVSDFRFFFGACCETCFLLCKSAITGKKVVDTSRAMSIEELEYEAMEREREAQKKRALAEGKERAKYKRSMSHRLHEVPFDPVLHGDRKNWTRLVILKRNFKLLEEDDIDVQELGRRVENVQSRQTTITEFIGRYKNAVQEKMRMTRQIAERRKRAAESAASPMRKGKGTTRRIKSAAELTKTASVTGRTENLVIPHATADLLGEVNQPFDRGGAVLVKVPSEAPIGTIESHRIREKDIVRATGKVTRLADTEYKTVPVANKTTVDEADLEAARKLARSMDLSPKASRGGAPEKEASADRSPSPSRFRLQVEGDAGSKPPRFGSTPSSMNHSVMSFDLVGDSFAGTHTPSNESSEASDFGDTFGVGHHPSEHAKRDLPTIPATPARGTRRAGAAEAEPSSLSPARSVKWSDGVTETDFEA
uniref:Polycystin cation channel PKD1/PKD2 domain-containing protein n=1 Tax=Phaeomonas parva TaxID=124430 RepID=A0A7S1TP90_9STRA|mmetsp:Transcript_11428/g.34694  ORF Transcript_11428/g.34694 Transcript_11428/m.34694 type:complete len:1068 (+) Transcript_11428:181-3384(+)